MIKNSNNSHTYSEANEDDVLVDPPFIENIAWEDYIKSEKNKLPKKWLTVLKSYNASQLADKQQIIERLRENKYTPCIVYSGTRWELYTLSVDNDNNLSIKDNTISGTLQLNKRNLGDSSCWEEVQCDYNPSTGVFKCGSDVQICKNISLVDIENRPNKRENCFGITGTTDQDENKRVELAASSDTEKRMWIGALKAYWQTIPSGTKWLNKVINDKSDINLMNIPTLILFLTKTNNDNGLAIDDFTENLATIGEEVPSDFLNIWKNCCNDTSSSTKRFGAYCAVKDIEDKWTFAKVDRYRMKKKRSYVLTSSTSDSNREEVVVECENEGCDSDEYDTVKILSYNNAEKTNHADLRVGGLYPLYMEHTQGYFGPPGTAQCDTDKRHNFHKKFDIREMKALTT